MGTVEDFVRNTVILKTFDEIHRRFDTVVPIKGVALLLSLYREDISERNVADIDLVVGRESWDLLIAFLEQLGYDVDPQKLHAGEYRFGARPKLTLTDRRGERPDVDLHSALITKKFYKSTVGNFEFDALANRTKVDLNGREVSILDRDYHWLYLAEHYCLHLFKDDKWLRDLFLLQRQLSPDQIDELYDKAKKYRFERVYAAARDRLVFRYGSGEVSLREMEIHRPRALFDTLSHPSFDLSRYGKHMGKIVGGFCKFVFISRSGERAAGFFRLLSPDAKMLKNVYYGVNSSLLLMLLWPFHLTFILITTVVFVALLYGSRLHSKRGYRHRNRSQAPQRVS